MHKGGWGGQPNRILVVSKELISRGHHVVISAPKGATLIARARKEGIETFDGVRFPKKFNPLTFVKEILAIRGVMDLHKIDVVHTHGSQDTWVSALAAKLFGNRALPVVRTRHNTFPVKNHIANRFLYRVLIDRVVVVSRAVTELFKETGVLGSKVDRCITIHSVVDAKGRFNPQLVEAAKIRKELEIPENAFVLMKTARLAREKGHSYALEVMREIGKTLSNVHLILAGEGPLRKELEDEADRLSLGNRIHFLGLRGDVPGLLKESEIFLFTPVAGESLGTSALEALAMEVPVVAFWMGGIDASVKDGETGYLVKVGDVSSAANRCLMLLTNPRGSKLIGKMGRRRMLRHFSPSSLAEGNLRVYEELLGSEKTKG